MLAYCPDIIVITETWLHSDIHDSEVFPNSYYLVRFDRDSRGGGVAIAIKEGLSFKKDEGICNHESVWCSINVNGTTVLIGGIYRRPNAPTEYLAELHDFLCHKVNERTKLILVGDFNLAGIDWENCTIGRNEHSSCEMLLNLMFSFSLAQLVKQPTRIQGQARSILDLAFVSKTLNPDISIENGISDHKMLLLTFDDLNPSSNVNSNISRIFVKDYRRADDVSIIDYIEITLDCLLQPQFGNVNDLWLKLKRIIAFCEEKFIPTIKKRVNRKTPWITRSIIHLKRRLQRARKKKTDITLINELSQMLRVELAAARNNFFANTLTNFLTREPRKFWRYLGKPKAPIEQMEIDGVVTDDANLIANAFNRYFQSVFTPASPSKISQPEYLSRMPDLVITEHGIVNLLVQLEEKKSPGPDGVPNAFLKRYAQQLSPLLQKIFSLSLETASVPADWLCAKVIPIFKKNGNKLLVNMYRPISLTSCCCKLMEHIINKAIVSYLEKNKLLYVNQHGFRKGLSTVTQLLEIAHDFAAAINSGLQVDAVFIDFAKAFDSVPHVKLIEKLILIGINSKIVSWIAAYLSCRTQFVKIKNAKSDTLDVTSGVPQGSVLGPTLFLIYINDIFSCVNSNVVMRLFADDCVVYTPVRSQVDQNNLNLTLTNIASWCDTWGMKINVSKTSSVTITRKKTPIYFTYLLSGSAVTRNTEVKYLGVTFTEKLTWETHIDNICAKAYQQLGFIRRKLSAAPSHVKLNAYKTLIRPILEYSAIVWNPHQSYLNKKLERIQNLSLRFIYSCYSRYDSVTFLRKRASIPTLECRRKTACMKFLFLLYHNCIGIDKDAYLKPPHHHSRRINHTMCIRPFAARCDVFKFSFFPRSIELWNTLPQHIMDDVSVDSFITSVESLFEDMHGL